MKNFELENAELNALTAEEMEETDGGDFGITLAIVALAVTVLSTDWDQVADDFQRGRQSTK